MNSNSLWRNFKTTINLHIKSNTYICVKFLQTVKIVHRYFLRTLTYLQNVWKLFTDILQIGENLPQITAVLSHICYRYLQTFNIYVSLVRVLKRNYYSLWSLKTDSFMSNVLNSVHTFNAKKWVSRQFYKNHKTSFLTKKISNIKRS